MSRFVENTVGFLLANFFHQDAITPLIFTDKSRVLEASWFQCVDAVLYVHGGSTMSAGEIEPTKPT